MLSTDLSERQLLDALPVSIYSLDLDGVLTSVHRASSRFSEEPGAPIPVVNDDNRGAAIWDALGDGISREQIEHAMRVLRAGRAPVVRWEIERTQHDHRVALAQMTPLHDEAHAVTGYVVSTTDITSLDRTREAAVDSGVALARTIELEQSYHEATQRLRHALRAEIVVIAVGDDDTTAPRVVYDYGTDGDRRSLEQRFATLWLSALRDGVVVSHGDSSVSLAAAITGQPTPLGVITVVTDEIESPERLADARRFLTSVAAQLAAAIERARQVAYAARRHRSGAIGEVAAGVAHELRNPIFGISSAAQLLRFRAREDPVMEKNVGRILREVERLNRMVATLLELGRPIALKLASTDPDTVWDDVLETERGRLESRVLAIRRTRPSAPATIPIDAEQLAQAFKSILSNAVDAAPEATDISLQSTVLPSGAWRCRLTNGGPPISSEMLPRVFEPFLTTKPGSTGVGLALAQRIVDEHHGTISIESTAEAGTTVSVTLPERPRTASLP